MMHRLQSDEFKTLLTLGPLVSIDLLIRSPSDQYLLGMRKNRPAQGAWFVPGGRVRKMESFDAAVQRLSAQELGYSLSLSDGTFCGVYQHFYDDCFFSEKLPTHYIVLAYEFEIESQHQVIFDEQHERFSWRHKADIIKDPSVHHYSKDYFRSHPET